MLHAVMKSICIFGFAACLAGHASASDPFFRGAKNQIGIYGAFGTGGSSLKNLVLPTEWEFVPFGMATMEYSQPATFFRMPARANLHAGWTFGWGRKDGEDWRDYTWPMIGLSWDVALLTWRGIYAGAGLGAFIKWRTDARQDSRFVFGTKTFVGYRLSRALSAEVFTQHFSNGNLTPVNGAYNFAGISILVNF